MENKKTVVFEVFLKNVSRSFPGAFLFRKTLFGEKNNEAIYYFLNFNQILVLMLYKISFLKKVSEVRFG